MGGAGAGRDAREGRLLPTPAPVEAACGGRVVGDSAEEEEGAGSGMVGGCDDEDTYWRDEVNDAFDGGPGSLYIWKGHTFVNCGSDGWLVDGTMMSDPSEFFYDEWM